VLEALSDIRGFPPKPTQGVWIDEKDGGLHSTIIKRWRNCTTRYNTIVHVAARFKDRLVKNADDLPAETKIVAKPLDAWRNLGPGVDFFAERRCTLSASASGTLLKDKREKPLSADFHLTIKNSEIGGLLEP
jgi:hypothetical protein